MPPLRIGLELGARTLRVAWATSRRGRIEWRCREQIRSEDSRHEALAEDLAKLLAPLRRFRFSARLLLAAPESYIRQVTLQVPDAARIPEALGEQLPKLIPFEVERAHVQFTMRRQQRREEGLECLLSVVACERSVLQRELESLWRIGWVPHGVVPSALALLQAARTLKAVDQEPVALVDIGQRRTAMALVDGGAVVYARDVALGDDHLTEALMSQVSVGGEALSLSREQAQALKREMGVGGSLPLSTGSAQDPTSSVIKRLPAPTYLSMIQPILEQLVSELRRTLSAGAAVMPTPPKRLLLSGDGAGLPNIDRWLAKQLAVPVSRLSAEGNLRAEGTSAVLAYGLALCEHPLRLDLQPRTWRRRGTVVRSVARLRQGILLAALILWLGAAFWCARERMLARQLSALETRWAALQPVASLQETIEAETQLVQRLMVNEGIPAEWFRRLTRGFPNPIRLTRLTIDAKREIKLAGEAQAREQSPEAYVSEMTLWLRQSNLCNSVQVDSTHRVGASGALVAFEMICQLP